MLYKTLWPRNTLRTSLQRTQPQFYSFHHHSSLFIQVKKDDNILMCFALYCTDGDVCSLSDYKHTNDNTCVTRFTLFYLLTVPESD